MMQALMGIAVAIMALGVIAIGVIAAATMFALYRTGQVEQRCGCCRDEDYEDETP